MMVIIISNAASTILLGGMGIISGSSYQASDLDVTNADIEYFKLESNLLKSLNEILGSNKKEGVTQAPKYYTEDTLLSMMERVGNEDIDKELELEKKGLGTSATRAGVIGKLISVGYLERKG